MINKMKNIINDRKNMAEINYIKKKFSELTPQSGPKIPNTIENVEKLEEIWSKKTSPIFKNDCYTNKLFYNYNDWIAGTFETTWYIKGGKNSKVDEGFELFIDDILLQKGSSKRLYRICQMKDNSILCSKIPYRPYNGLIEIPVNKNTLEYLFKNNIDEFKSVYRRNNTPYGIL